jgi:hypothetical protein
MAVGSPRTPLNRQLTSASLQQWCAAPMTSSTQNVKKAARPTTLDDQRAKRSKTRGDLAWHEHHRHVVDVLASALVGLAELADHLLRRMPASLHREVLSAHTIVGDGLSHQADQPKGLTSPAPGAPVSANDEQLVPLEEVKKKD